MTFALIATALIFAEMYYTSRHNAVYYYHPTTGHSPYTEDYDYR